MLLSKASRAQACLTLAEDGKVLAASCAGSAAQQWYVDGERFKSKAGSGECLAASPESNEVVSAACDGSLEQKWVRDDSGSVKSKAAPNKCLSLEPVGENLWLYDCHGMANQKWDFFGAELRSRKGLACLDSSNDNVHLNEKNCNGAPSQIFIVDASGQWKSAAKKGACLAVHPVTGSVYLAECRSGKSQSFYADSEGSLKTASDSSCASVDAKTGGLFMGKGCGSDAKQHFFWMRAAQDAAKALQARGAEGVQH